MPISEAHVGRQYPPTAPYAVTAGKIAEFAAAVGDDSPRYAGSDPEAPPTFAALICSPAWQLLFNDPELGLALPRIVHTDQRFSYTRPLRAGDVVTGTLSITRVRPRGTAELIAASVDIATTAGESVCVAAATFLHDRSAA